jgi:hypothetical protein
MSGFSTYEAQRLINELRAQTLYVALFTADPTDDNITANEVSAGWYVRRAIGALSAPVGTGVVTSNSNQITFPAVTGSSITTSHYGVYDAITGGNLVMSFPITDSNGTPTPRTFAVDDVPVFAAGELRLTYV